MFFLRLLDLLFFKGVLLTVLFQQKLQSEFDPNFFDTWPFALRFGEVWEVVCPSSWRVLCMFKCFWPFLTEHCSEKSMIKRWSSRKPHV